MKPLLSVASLLLALWLVAQLAEATASRAGTPGTVDPADATPPGEAARPRDPSERTRPAEAAGSARPGGSPAARTAARVQQALDHSAAARAAAADP